MNRYNTINFENGELLNHTEKAAYLGGILTRGVNANIEIQNIIADCIPTLTKLDTFWKTYRNVPSSGNSICLTLLSLQNKHMDSKHYNSQKMQQTN